MKQPFKDHMGKTWDLADPKTYEDSWFPLSRFSGHTCDELRIAVETEVGLSLYYMGCLYPNLNWGKQHRRVVDFGRTFAREILDNSDLRNDRIWLLAKLFAILDETENQC